MMEKQFFTFSPKHLFREVQVEPVPKYYSYKLLRETDSIVSNSKYEIKKGSKFYDVLPYVDWSQFLISERFKNILEKNGFNGYKCFPAEIKEGMGAYYGWLNINEVGPIIKEDEKANIVWFDLDTWHDYDIFHLGGTFMDVCTIKVKEILENESITNVEFFPCYGLTQ